MKGCAEDDPSRLDTPDQLVNLLRSAGFLPLFSNTIPGFSVEEHTLAEHWWTGEDSDPWQWRHILSSHPEIAYGKFFGKKAGFIHKDWFPVFATTVVTGTTLTLYMMMALLHTSGRTRWISFPLMTR